MVRSAATVLALLILPGIALAQQAQGTHTVVDGDTLWDLAESYYGDPFDWRRIWDANQAQIDDPNLILPGQVLVIPGTEAPAPEPPPEAEPQPMPEEPAGEMRTIFYRDTSAMAGGVVGGAAVDYVAVSRDLVYSAPRLTGFAGDPPHTGTLLGAAGGRDATPTLRSHARVRVRLDTPARVGDELQIFKIGVTIEDVGRVVRPTGVLTVSNIVEDGVVGVITREFGQIEIGHFVGPVPSYELMAGQYAQDVSGGDAAMIMGFATPSTLPSVGDVAFLDLGSSAGVTVGDEFTLFNPTDRQSREGFLQVVGVQDDLAAARIVNLTDAVFEQGVVVQLTKKMR